MKSTLLFFILLTLNISTKGQTAERMLKGRIDFQKQLIDSKEYPWFPSGVENYSPSDSIIKLISPKLIDIEITIFMGTWCSDTQMNLPQFYKVLQKANYPLQKIELIGVDRDKISTTNQETKYGISAIPVFIIKKKGIEIGRITESFQNSPELDLFELLKQ